MTEDALAQPHRSFPHWHSSSFHHSPLSSRYLIFPPSLHTCLEQAHLWTPTAEPNLSVRQWVSNWSRLGGHIIQVGGGGMCDGSWITASHS